jgi:hypothetical protein
MWAHTVDYAKGLTGADGMERDGSAKDFSLERSHAFLRSGSIGGVKVALPFPAGTVSEWKGSLAVLW